jgi:hypothetical protein
VGTPNDAPGRELLLDEVIQPWLKAIKPKQVEALLDIITYPNQQYLPCFAGVGNR